MGTEAVWIPAVMAAVGTGVSMYNTRKTAKKQDNALARQIESQADKKLEADGRVNKLVDDTAASSPDDEKNKALAQYTAQLKGGAASATQALGPIGGASDRFNAETQAAALGVGEYGATRAGLLSRIDAPLRQREAESVSRGDATGDLREVDRSARVRNFLDGLRTQRAGTRNPWLDGVSSLLSGAASAYSGSGTSGASMGGGDLDFGALFGGNTAGGF